MNHQKIKHLSVPSDYSKSGKDLAKENQYRRDNEKKLISQQKEISKRLLECPQRRSCLICGASLNSSKFDHRGIHYRQCSNCGHVQSAQIPPLNYPFSQSSESSFHNIYPALSSQDYENRKNRIYKPKLDWFVKKLLENSYDMQFIRSKSWFEIGCGAGYFLSSLQDIGVSSMRGSEMDEVLVQVANEKLGNQDVVYKSNLPIDECFKQYPANIYIAFFVLEHLPEPKKFWSSIKQLPSGTLLYFSVPVFGFSCLLEQAFPKHYARNLDNVMHTQLYTEESIAFALDFAKFEPIAQWVFGQDAEDLCRIFANGVVENLPYTLREDFFKKLSRAMDEMQKALDHHHLADQRHIIARKK